MDTGQDLTASTLDALEQWIARMKMAGYPGESTVYVKTKSAGFRKVNLGHHIRRLSIESEAFGE